MLHGNFCFKVCDDSQSAVRISYIFQKIAQTDMHPRKYNPLGLFAPALALPWLLEGLAYVGTAMADILISVGAMERRRRRLIIPPIAVQQKKQIRHIGNQNISMLRIFVIPLLLQEIINAPLYPNKQSMLNSALICIENGIISGFLGVMI